MNKTLEESIARQLDAFSRDSLGIKYPKIISSNNLYEITKVERWSRTIKRRRLNWLGHVMRLPIQMSIYEILQAKEVAIDRRTWMKTIKKDFEVGNII